jgi:exodeoxyribonuclease X-like protein
MICPSCLIEHEDSMLTASTVKIADGRIQIKGSCPTTKQFVKWLPQSAPDQPRTIYFGKYKEHTYDDVARDDPDYLVWLIENTQIDKIRRYAQEALDRAD